MGYKAVARLKVGIKDDNKKKGVYIERGESVSEEDVDNFDELVKGGSVVTDEAYAVMFPETVQGANQAYGTPSNLPDIEGTELQANPPEEDVDEDEDPLA